MGKRQRNNNTVAIAVRPITVTDDEGERDSKVLAVRDIDDDDKMIHKGKNKSEDQDVVRVGDGVGQIRKEWNVVDEMTSWESYWLPNWDVELVGNEAFHVFYGDVVWDYDIWNLKTITQVPES